MVDLGSLMLLISVFGWKIAVLYVLLGLAIAVAGGTMIQRLHMEKHVEGFILTAGGTNIDAPDLARRDRLAYAKGQTLSTFRKVFIYIMIGVGIGAVIHNWIPEAWIQSILGSDNPFGVVLATAVGIPMYGDIFGTIPIAEALYGKGALLGSILSFMMAVTTLSLPSMIMLRKAIKPTFLIFFIACLASIALKLPHEIAAPAGIIGASNFFELAVAVDISLFGTKSPAALATIVGVLTEVPVMLALVRIANRTKGWFPA